MRLHSLCLAKEFRTTNKIVQRKSSLYIQ